MTEPAWALGYKVENLKRYADIFAYCHKPYAHGAFGLVKERDIANALSAKAFWPGRGGGRDASAIGRYLKSGSTQHDFTGRSRAIGAGAFFVSAFAARSVSAGYELLSSIGKKLDPLGRFFVEIFEEDLIAKRAVHEAGLQYAFSKVMAGSEIKGVYCNSTAMFGALGTLNSYRPLPAVEEVTLRATSFMWWKGHGSSVYRDLSGELKKADAEWAQHYSGYNVKNTWTAFALRGYDRNDPGFIIKPAEMSRKWKADNSERMAASCENTILWEKFPTVQRLIGFLPVSEVQRVRFMRLAPVGGELSRHADITDREAGVADGKIARLHVPVVTNPDVAFRGWSSRGIVEQVAFPEGRVCYLDQRKPHQVINRGEHERIHLVIDAVSNANLRRYLMA